MLMLFYAILGLLAASFFAFVVIEASRALLRIELALAGPIVLLFFCSLLSWSASFELPWLPWLAASLLFFAALFSVVAKVQKRGVERDFVKSLGEFFGKKSLFRWVSVAALVGLLLTFVFAALPAYRYDQWSYHLFISKVIAVFGKLPPLIFDDHVFFSGTYEYLFLIVRAIWNDDIFLHSFADAFTFLMCLIFATKALVTLGRRLDFALPPSVLLAAFCFFGLPEHEAIFNLKPDSYLFVFALLLLMSMSSALSKLRFRDGFYVAFLVLAPLSFKLTWAHFALAAGTAFSFRLSFIIWQRGLLRDWGRKIYGVVLGALCGSVAGAVILAPFLVKNLKFFDNPLHPMQLGPFHTPFRTAQMAAFWKDGVSSSASDLQSYFLIFSKNLYVYPLRSIYWWLPLLVVSGIGFCLLKDPRGVRLLSRGWILVRERGAVSLKSAAVIAERKETLFLLVATTVVYFLLWPLFYGEAIFSRFIFSSFAIVVVACLAWISYLWRRCPGLAVLALLFPMVFNGQLEVRVRDLAKGLPLRIDAFYSEKRRQAYAAWTLSQVVNSHRGIGLRFDENIVIMDLPYKYFLNTSAISIDSYMHDILMDKSCSIWNSIRNNSVSYLVSLERDFYSWPVDYQPVIADSVALDARGKVRWIPQELIERHLAECLKNVGSRDR